MHDQVTICRTEDTVEVFYTNKPWRKPACITILKEGYSLKEMAQEIYELCACLGVQVTTVNSRD